MNKKCTPVDLKCFIFTILFSKGGVFLRFDGSGNGWGNGTDWTICLVMTLVPAEETGNVG